MTVNIQTIPDELLIEIFKWIPFDDLQNNIMPVCRLWHKIISTHYRYPRLLLIRGSSKSHRVANLTARYSLKIMVLKISDAFDDWVMACLKKQRWSNLRTLIIESSYPSLDCAGLSVDDLNYMIDRSPRLRCLKIREYRIQGNIQSLFEKIDRRKIRKFSFLNRYLVIDNIEKFFDLKNMKVFQVYCHFFSRNSLDNFFSNNAHSLTSLALHGGSLPDGDDQILTRIGSCLQLMKLTLVGPLKISFQGLLCITTLPKLNTLKLDISQFIPSTALIQLLNHESMRKLRNLRLLWHRPVDRRELANLHHCCEHLNKLSLGFWDDDSDSILDAIKNLMKVTLNLRRFKLLSMDSQILNISSTLMMYNNLISIKFVLPFNSLEEREADHNNHLEEWLNSIRSSAFNYEYSISETDFRITLTKKTALMGLCIM